MASTKAKASTSSGRTSAGTSPGRTSASATARPRSKGTIASAVRNTIVTFVSGWWVELLLLTGVLTCAFALVSLWGWSASDPTLLDPGPGRVENPCGPLGALLSDGLYAAFGWGAWGVVVPGVLLGLGLAGRRVLGWGRGVAAGAMYATLLAAGHLVLRPGGAFPPGGFVGRALGEGLEAVVGSVGAWIVLLGVLMALATVVLRIQWGRVVARAVDAAERMWPPLKAAAAKGAGAVLVLLWSATRSLGFAAWAGLAAIGRSGVAGFTGIGSGFRRMGHSLVRSDDNPFPELAMATASGASFVEDDDRDLPDATATSPGAGLALAEVVWEPTTVGPASEPGSNVLGMFPDLTPRPTKSDPGPPSCAVPVEVELDDDEPLPEDPLDPPTPASLSAAEKARKKATPTPTSKLVVHHNKLLDGKVVDDGGAIVKADRQATFKLPTLSLLDEVPEQKAVFDDDELRRLAALVEEKLLSFKIGGEITAVRPGPVVTIFEFLPEAGIKVSRIAALQDDLAMALRAVSVRIVAPVPGKGVVGIEIPSPTRLTIYLRELLASPEFRDTDKALPCVLGKDVEGRPMIGDLAAMPHLLVGGTTGSGKSVGVNGMLMSLLFTRTPDELRFLLVDPKKLEFELYHGIPHLLYPIMTEPKEASAALSWACREMDDRYEILARWGVRNIIGYNKKVERELGDWTGEKARKYAPKGWTEDDGPLSMPKKLPYIVIVIDELADLMMVAGKEVEESICRIAQKARACGIHLIVATQRPSVDVVTGLIKANLPTRISFQLRTRTDSRTVLDAGGAEQLLGRGDLLYLPPGIGNLVRCHGAFVSDEEVGRLTDALRAQAEPEYIEEIVAGSDGDGDADLGERDDLYDSAVRIVVQLGKASTSLVQRHLKIGYNRAANIIDQMEQAGVVGPADGARPREVLISGVDLD